MGQLRTSIVALTVALGTALALTAVAGPAHAEWIRDLGTGCSIWGAAPKASDTVSWSGKCKGGKATGRGVLQWYSKRERRHRYEGNLREGYPHGRGKIVWADGNRYVGKFQNGTPQGAGVFTWAGGARFRGEFLDGYPDGDGECLVPGEKWFPCHWKDGRQVP